MKSLQLVKIMGRNSLNFVTKARLSNEKPFNDRENVYEKEFMNK